jgi:hypothetical protein
MYYGCVRTVRTFNAPPDASLEPLCTNFKDNMTTIFCSNKLNGFLGKDYFISTNNKPGNVYGDWNAHLFTIARHRYLILVNNKAYYSVIFENIKKADFKEFSALFRKRLTEQLIFDEVIEPSESDLLTPIGSSLMFSKTNNDKKTIGTMNDFIFNYRWAYEDPLWAQRSMLEKNHTINNTLTGAGRNEIRDYGCPIEDMQALLRNRG